jgi:hypothetical protein
LAICGVCRRLADVVQVIGERRASEGDDACRNDPKESIHVRPPFGERGIVGRVAN